MIPHVRAWWLTRQLRRQSAYPGKLEYPRILYHYRKAPTGRLFQTPADAKRFTPLRGWVDTPNHFPKIRIGAVDVKSWWAEWEWLVKAVAVLLSLLAGAVALLQRFGYLKS